MRRRCEWGFLCLFGEVRLMRQGIVEAPRSGGRWKTLTAAGYLALLLPVPVLALVLLGSSGLSSQATELPAVVADGGAVTPATAEVAVQPEGTSPDTALANWEYTRGKLAPL